MLELNKKLKRAAARVVGWRLQLACLLALAAVLGVLVALTMLDKVSPMQERTSLALMGGVLVFGFVFLVGQCVLVELRRPGNAPMARRVEQDNPELMDLFNCAVDLMDRKPASEMNPMEKRVVEEAGRRTAELGMEQALLPRPAFRQLTLFGIAGCCGMLAYSQVFSPVRKALHSLDDLRSGMVSGVSVLPGTGEFPKGSDVVVQARIYRGTQKAWVEYENPEGKLVKELMRLEGGGSSDALPILEFVAAEEAGWTWVRSEMPHGLVDGQAVELTGTGWADGVHATRVSDAHGFSIAQELPSAPGAGGTFCAVPAPVFYFYGVDAPRSYRVVTPELTSDWHQLVTYVPPRIDAVRWKVTPPAYTQMDVIEQEGYGALSFPEGSLLQLDMEAVPTQVTAYLVRDGNRLEFGENEATFTRSWIPSEDAEYTLEVETPEGRTFTSPEISVKIIPDTPPIVEIRKPAKDIQLHKDDTLQLEAFAVDDYGVAEASLQVRLPQGVRTQELPVLPVEREKKFFGNVSMAGLPLEVGDIFSYFVQVTDNKYPQGQKTRSGVYFVELIPPEQKPQDGQDGPEPKEIPLRNLINANKQLIRETYLGMGLEGADRDAQNLKVATDAHKLKNDLNRLHSENKEKLAGPLGEMLLQAAASIENAEKTGARGQLEESLDSSENSLRILVRMSAMLRRPPTKSNKPQKPKDGEGEGQQAQPQEKKPEESSQDLAKQFEAMQKDLAQARKLLEDQKGLNSRISRNARTNRTGKPNEDLAEKQAGISGRTRELRDRVYDRTGKLAHAQPFDQAENEMKDAKGQLEGDSPSGAEPHGLRAADALGNSVAALESSLREMGTQMLQGLENQGRTLAEQQKSLQKSTEGAATGDGEKLRKGQQGVNQGSQDLLASMEQVARALEKVSPRATEALFQSSSEARKGGVEKSGKRAENALNYEIFPKASKEQEKVGRELDKTSESLADIKRKLSNEGNEMLQQMLQEISQAQRGLPGMTQQEVSKSRDQIASQIEGLEETTRNVMLQTLVQQLKHGNFSDEPSVNVGQTRQILGQTLEVLQSFLWQEAVQDQLKRNREGTAPPRKYKGQVQEYFRRLAEGTL